jgi:hypothetical protein
MPFWACIPLRGPLRDANVSLLRKKSEEGQISSEAIFQQPARAAMAPLVVAWVAFGAGRRTFAIR